jgi:PREDICTED: similar to septin
VHCCFYFISPIGYGLKPLDILALKQLHNKVNLIPIIGKADALTSSEVSELKKSILRDLEMNGINIYSVPDCDSDEDDDYKDQIRNIKEAIPFAISSSFLTHEIKDRKVQGRLYPWGMVETENPNHSDFVKLKSLLVTHLQDLREVTAEVHYENYRAINLVKKITPSTQVDLDMLDNFSKGADRRLLEKEAELKRMQQELQILQQRMKEKENVHNGN